MKKRSLTIIVVLTFLLSALLGMTACKNSGSSTDAIKVATKKAHNAYAMSAISGIGYLADSNNATILTETGDLFFDANGLTQYAEILAEGNSSGVSNEDIEGIKKCLRSFDNVIIGGGFEQEIKDNTDTNPLFQSYTKVMEISVLTGVNTESKFMMYFNETGTKTEVEEDDDGTETEITTSFEGVASFNEELFVVRGEIEIEIEGKKFESSIEFKTYKNLSETAILPDYNNYVEVSQSFEDGENEYEYTFVENGVVVLEIELEYEQTYKGVEIEFEMSQTVSGTLTKKSFKITKGLNNTFKVSYMSNKVKKIIIVEKQTDGSYTFNFGE